MLAWILNTKFKLLMVFIMSVLPSFPDNNTIFTAVNRDIETWNMKRLARVQATEGVKINDFSTDGCSGGLSATWQQLSDRLPAFKQKFGQRPPWEECCVLHDQAYWRGETESGFDKRLAADLALKECVLNYGAEHQQHLSEKLSIDKQKLEKEFQLVAELMYKAVRIGGKPCSYLPWRWGYGWPHCPVLPNQGSTTGE